MKDSPRSLDTPKNWVPSLLHVRNTDPTSFAAIQGLSAPLPASVTTVGVPNRWVDASACAKCVFRCIRSAVPGASDQDSERSDEYGAGQAALRFGCKRAGLRNIGSHVLRHTFCSHLAMRGAAPKAIQELVGHSTLTMTLRYMHLAPSALAEAMGLLNFGQPVGSAERAAV